MERLAPRLRPPGGALQQRISRMPSNAIVSVSSVLPGKQQAVGLSKGVQQKDDSPIIGADVHMQTPTSLL